MTISFIKSGKYLLTLSSLGSSGFCHINWHWTLCTHPTTPSSWDLPMEAHCPCSLWKNHVYFLYVIVVVVMASGMPIFYLLLWWPLEDVEFWNFWVWSQDIHLAWFPKRASSVSGWGWIRPVWVLVQVLGHLWPIFLYKVGSTFLGSSHHHLSLEFSTAMLQFPTSQEANSYGVHVHCLFTFLTRVHVCVSNFHFSKWMISRLHWLGKERFSAPLGIVVLTLYFF